MKKADYISYQHKIIVDKFLGDVILHIDEVGTDESFGNIMEVIDIVIDYHNEFNKDGGHQGYLQDYLNIIPINITCAAQGYLIGLSSEKNMNIMTHIRKAVNEASWDCVKELQDLEIEKE